MLDDIERLTSYLKAHYYDREVIRRNVSTCMDVRFSITEPHREYSYDFNTEENLELPISSDDAITIDVVQREWPRILKLFGQQSQRGVGYLEKARPIELEYFSITLAFSDAFARDRIKNKGVILVEKVINLALSTENYKVECVLEYQDSFLAEVLEIFGGQVIYSEIV